MKKFQATYRWTMACTRIIEAEDEDHALERAYELGLEVTVDNEGWYVEDSFVLDSLTSFRQQECPGKQADGHRKPRIDQVTFIRKPRQWASQTAPSESRPTDGPDLGHNRERRRNFVLSNPLMLRRR